MTYNQEMLYISSQLGKVKKKIFLKLFIVEFEF